MKLNGLSRVPFKYVETMILLKGRSKKHLIETLELYIESYKLDGLTIVCKNKKTYIVVRQTFAYSYPEEYQVRGNIFSGYYLRINTKLGAAFPKPFNNKLYFDSTRFWEMSIEVFDL